MNSQQKIHRRKPIMILGEGRSILILCVLVLFICGPPGAYVQQAAASETLEHTETFERIILTWKESPATSQAVTWRTNRGDDKAVAEIAPADASPDFVKNAKKFKTVTTELQSGTHKVYYHSVNFTNLQPDTLYAYRVGNGDSWSEWFHFRTANTQADPFSFIYFGDAQNHIQSLWSRSVRAAFLHSPEARFMVHVGDMVEYGDSDSEWQEWFNAAGWIFAMVPSIPAAGNHEYRKSDRSSKRLSPYWLPQFMLPENGIAELKETVYYIDFQGVRIVVLNSNRKLEKQAQWLENILEQNPNRWTVIVFHHPVQSAYYLENEKELKTQWKPLFEKYDVDLVLQGHEHLYARATGQVNNQKPIHGPVYITSVSGPKMYKSSFRKWAHRLGENIQLFQVISISGNSLSYQALTVTGELYDAFNLLKEENGKKRFIEKIPPDAPERRLE